MLHLKDRVFWIMAAPPFGFFAFTNHLNYYIVHWKPNHQVAHVFASSPLDLPQPGNSFSHFLKNGVFWIMPFLKKRCVRYIPKYKWQNFQAVCWYKYFFFFLFFKKCICDNICIDQDFEKCSHFCDIAYVNINKDNYMPVSVFIFLSLFAIFSLFWLIKNGFPTYLLLIVIWYFIWHVIWHIIWYFRENKMLYYKSKFWFINVKFK